VVVGHEHGHRRGHAYDDRVDHRAGLVELHSTAPRAA
jgi:hypothetical protein